MLREMQAMTKLIMLRKNKSSLGGLSCEMVLPFKRKDALLNQQHLGGGGFWNNKVKLTSKKQKIGCLACKVRMSLNSANCRWGKSSRGFGKTRNKAHLGWYHPDVQGEIPPIWWYAHFTLTLSFMTVLQEREKYEYVLIPVQS